MSSSCESSSTLLALFASESAASKSESSTPKTTLPKSCTRRLYESHANRRLPDDMARPSTLESLRPTLSIVSIMPGIETAAPDLTDMRSGLLRDPHVLPVRSSRRAMDRRTPAMRPCGRLPPAA